jgi:hypothetical protein
VASPDGWDIFLAALNDIVAWQEARAAARQARTRV